MSEFKIIETQEQFDAAISDRLKRDREAYAKKFEGYKSPAEIEKLTESLNMQIKALEDAAAATQQTLAEKDAEIAKGAQYRTDLEKTRIALAAGLKIDYADRLRGETEEEWKADAEMLAKDFASVHIAPLGSGEPTMTNADPEAVAKAKFSNWLNNQTL